MSFMNTIETLVVHLTEFGLYTNGKVRFHTEGGHWGSSLSPENYDVMQITVIPCLPRLYCDNMKQYQERSPRNY